MKYQKERMAMQSSRSAWQVSTPWARFVTCSSKKPETTSARQCPPEAASLLRWGLEMASPNQGAKEQLPGSLNIPRGQRGCTTKALVSNFIKQALVCRVHPSACRLSLGRGRALGAVAATAAAALGSLLARLGHRLGLLRLCCSDRLRRFCCRNWGNRSRCLSILHSF